jgi:hypothetical protein
MESCPSLRILVFFIILEIAFERFDVAVALEGAKWVAIRS